MLEKPLESALIRFLELRGYYARKIHSGGVRISQRTKTGWKTYMIKLAPEGTPDIFCCIRGLFVGIEVKKDAEELAEWERQWEKFQRTRVMKKSYERSVVQHVDHERVMKAGGIVLTVSSLDELQRDLREVEKIAERMASIGSISRK